MPANLTPVMAKAVQRFLGQGLSSFGAGGQCLERKFNVTFPTGCVISFCSFLAGTLSPTEQALGKLFGGEYSPGAELMIAMLTICEAAFVLMGLQRMEGADRVLYSTIDAVGMPVAGKAASAVCLIIFKHISTSMATARANASLGGRTMMLPLHHLSDGCVESLRDIRLLHMASGGFKMEMMGSSLGSRRAREEDWGRRDPERKRMDEGFCALFQNGKCTDANCKREHRLVNCQDFRGARGCSYGEQCKFHH